ncbi:MAG: hypothetical protein WAZ18_02520 [Alphaproteobacteria bacterium]
MGPKYPVLPYGMDPDCLEARVAFHLRRLGFATSRKPQNISVDYWSNYLTARTDLTLRDATFIANQLGVDTHELSRDLTSEEREVYIFYQNAHVHYKHTSHALANLNKTMGRGSQKRLAAWAGVSITFFNFLVKPNTPSRPTPKYLQYQHAQGIAENLHLEGGPWFVFDGAASPMPQQSKTFLSPTELPVHSPLTQTMYKKTRTPER